MTTDSNFEIAVQTVLKHEGLLVDDKRDPGGITNYGVSLRFALSTKDLELFDIDLDGDIDADDIRALTPERAKKAYYKHFWKKYKYAQYDLVIGKKLLDLGVTMGHKQVAKCIQRAVRAASLFELKDDGILGVQSVLAIKACNPMVLGAALCSEAAGFYRSLNKPRYINGWLNRAYA